jgi:hypothetical protein
MITMIQDSSFLGFCFAGRSLYSFGCIFSSGHAYRGCFVGGSFLLSPPRATFSAGKTGRASLTQLCMIVKDHLMWYMERSCVYIWYTIVVLTEGVCREVVRCRERG